MDSYSKYLRHSQEVYFMDVILKTFPKAKCKVVRTNWEHQQILPFHIGADIQIGYIEYYASIEFRNWTVKKYDTNYGMFVLGMSPNNTKDCDVSNAFSNIIINPLTLESDYNIEENERDRFYKELAYWAENFSSDRYVSPKDGKVGPKHIDVILTYEQNKRKNKS